MRVACLRSSHWACGFLGWVLSVGAATGWVQPMPSEPWWHVGRHRGGRSLLRLASSEDSSRPSQPGMSTTEAASLSGPPERVPSCPYTRTFARHRIDLSSTRSKARGFIEDWWDRLVTPSLARRRDMLQSTLGPSVTVQVLTVEPPTTPHKTPSPPAQTRNAATMAALWKAAADWEDRLVRTKEPSARPADMACLFSDPHVDATVVRHWVEIYDWWLREQGHPPGISVNYMHVQESIPCVRFLATTEYGRSLGPAREPTSSVPDAAILQATRQWVKRLLVDQQICPFTRSVKYSGQGLADANVPVARIDYVASHAHTLTRLLADTWVAMDRMLQAGPTQTSSILLAAPAWNHDFPLWAGPVFAVLEATVVAARAEQELGVVCFHPQYQVSDGRVFCGFGHMHSVPRLEQWCRDQRAGAVDNQLSSSDIAAGGAYQRRTPHATINVLRAEQLQAAEQKRSTPELYNRNIQVLHTIGWDKLQQDLETEQRLR